MHHNHKSKVVNIFSNILVTFNAGFNHKFAFFLFVIFSLLLSLSFSLIQFFNLGTQTGVSFSLFGLTWGFHINFLGIYLFFIFCLWDTYEDFFLGILRLDSNIESKSSNNT